MYVLKKMNLVQLIRVYKNKHKQWQHFLCSPIFNSKIRYLQGLGPMSKVKVNGVKSVTTPCPQPKKLHKSYNLYNIFTRISPKHGIHFLDLKIKVSVITIPYPSNQTKFWHIHRHSYVTVTCYLK